MPVHNADIAVMFEEMADLLDIQGENPFRIRAYRNAARTVQDLGRELRDMVEKGEDLTALPGIGEDLAAKIREMVETGTMKAVEKLRAQLPAGITDLLQIPGLGPKKVKALWKELNITTLDRLRAAAEAGKIRNLAGFGEKTEQNLLQALQARAGAPQRFLRAYTVPYVEALVDYLRRSGADRIEVAGSYRRGKETVGDLDLLATAKNPARVMRAFVKYDEVRQALSQGETKSSVVLKSGIQVDLRIVEPKSFGAALQYFTGSKAHNIAIRRLGQQDGLKINESGVCGGERYVAGKTEEEVYRKVGLPLIPPELREDAGELEAARRGELPHLVELGDLRGDLHLHTTASDGQHGLAEMAEAAQRRGYEYIAVTEHSKRLAMIGGLGEKELAAQVEEIAELNRRLRGIRVLTGIEVDILEDGRLDLPDGTLRELDVVIGSVHSHFKLPREKQTARILKAMDHEGFTMLGHPTGRLLLEREPYEVDLERVVRHAAERGCFIELNAHPLRLDLEDTFCRLAKEVGVLVCICTDAHSTLDLNNLQYGVSQARRGWLEKKDVLNTRPLKQLLPLLARAMGKKAPT